MRLTLDKLPGIRADLVRLDDDWHEWKFFHFLEALRKWCEKNPNASSDLPNYSQYRPQGVGQGKLQGEKGLSMQGKKPSDQKPVFIASPTNKFVDCEQVKEVAARRKVLIESKLCFNCTV